MGLDLLWALRWLRKNPSFAAGGGLYFSLGDRGEYGRLQHCRCRPLAAISVSFRRHSLVRVEESSTGRRLSGVPVKDYQRWADRSDVFEKIAPYIRDTVTLTGDGEPEQVIAVRSLGLFPVLGVPARLGRTLATSDDEEGPRNVAVLSDRLWRRRYHGDPSVIGRGITISGEAYVIAGVMPPDFEFHYSDAELWTPLRLTPTSPWLQVAARLRPGVSATQAQSALGIVAHQMEQEDPKDHAGLKIVVKQWRDTPDEKYKLTLVFVLVAVG